MNRYRNRSTEYNHSIKGNLMTENISSSSIVQHRRINKLLSPKLRANDSDFGYFDCWTVSLPVLTS